MIKQKTALRLGIVSVILGSLVGFPLTANAGKDVIPGTTSDSSGTVGDVFDTTVITPNVTTRVEGVRVSADSRNGEIILTVTRTIQVALNQFATSLFDESSSASSQRIQVRELFTRRGKNVVSFTEKTKQDWVSYGVQETRIEVFLVKLSECVTVVGKSDTDDPLFVDVNKLSAAIDEYNLLVKENNGGTLQKLSQDETFMEISSILKELRSALETTI
jgi:hypothetical protein